jgi:hypothetical protein
LKFYRATSKKAQKKQKKKKKLPAPSLEFLTQLLSAELIFIISSASTLFPPLDGHLNNIEYKSKLKKYFLNLSSPSWSHYRIYH